MDRFRGCSCRIYPHSDRITSMPVKTYPELGSHAADILDYVSQNPGVSKNKIIETLKKNPGIVRDIMKTLVRRGLVVDRVANGQHSYTIGRGFRNA